ncbi:TetR/AcrR family transcriptional regulator [Micropruina sonneratiae]|uniref:TetR/AcrR family transcriptional regulator n=1 Tax=Micropruina sonneratiae TaxID=2986940 RepID=UPI002226DD83|nr:TetR/AcrR family transcriptional regulator [Micropruina sp. KQZ13P-5]MCW3157791.1 TetR/AcrR family transcriptional regulator [Micropruina sp. KQZ13P-5]
MDSRERLVQAMGELMWQRGYAATSPRAVREQSGVGQGSTYHHFPSKRDLALAALERNCVDLLPATEQLLSAPGDPLHRLEAYLTRPLPVLKGCKVGRMTQDPLVAGDPGLLKPIADAFAAVHDALVMVIREAVALGELSDTLDPDRLAHLLAATIQGGYVLSIAAQDPRPSEDARAGALELLRASAPASPPAATSAATPHERNPQ